MVYNECLNVKKVFFRKTPHRDDRYNNMDEYKRLQIQLFEVSRALFEESARIFFRVNLFVIGYHSVSWPWEDLETDGGSNLHDADPMALLARKYVRKLSISFDSRDGCVNNSVNVGSVLEQKRRNFRRRNPGAIFHSYYISAPSSLPFLCSIPHASQTQPRVDSTPPPSHHSTPHYKAIRRAQEQEVVCLFSISHISLFHHILPPKRQIYASHRIPKCHDTPSQLVVPP